MTNNIPAFPLHNHGTQTLGMHLSGMTLRDYFAVKALQCYMDDALWHTDVYKTAAKASYALADAMLKAREQ